MIVVFDTASFRELYPQFASKIRFSDKLLENAFKQASMMCNNTENSIIPFDPENGVFNRELLLNLLTCHILTLNSRGTVGALTSASEGSVSSGFWVANKNNAAWFMQTPCGYEYWQLTQIYRLGGLFVQGEPRH